MLPHLAGCDLIHITGITPAQSTTCRKTIFDVSAAAQDTGLPVSFDVNYRDALWSPAEARRVCDDVRRNATVFKVGLDEAETIWGGKLSATDHARQFWGGNTQLTVVTTGDSGAVAFDGQTVVEHPGFRVEVIDPVGAGDAFVAGFLAGILEARSLSEFLRQDMNSRASELLRALELGNACGALVCTRHGDTVAMPDTAQAREFIGRSE